MLTPFLASLVKCANKTNDLAGELRPAVEKAANEDWSEDNIEKLNLAREHLQIAEALIRCVASCVHVQIEIAKFPD